MTTPRDPNQGQPTGGRSRRVRPRDWAIVGVVAVVAAGLGIYLLTQPDDDDTAGGTSPTATVQETQATQQTSSGIQGSTDSAASSAAPSADSSTGSSSPETETGQETEGSDAEDGTAPSVVQPPGVTTPDEPTPIGPLGDLARRVDDDPFALGAVDAPVVMVEFADYRCPFCSKFSRDLKPQLVEKYVDEGVLRIEWRDFPFFGPQSEQAAIAGRAAAKQEKFWEFNDAISHAAPETGHADLGEEDFMDFAEEIGVPDLEAFRADLADPELATSVEEDMEEGATIGVFSVPSFVVNGYPIVGAQPIDDFYDVVDGVLALQ